MKESVLLQTRSAADWRPYEPVIAVYTENGERLQEPVMRREISEGNWEYRRMTLAETEEYSQRRPDRQFGW